MVEYFIAMPQQTDPAPSSHQAALRDSPKKIVDLLKALAMTRSGRQAAEDEEKRLIIQKPDPIEVHSMAYIEKTRESSNAALPTDVETVSRVLGDASDDRL